MCNIYNIHNNIMYSIYIIYIMYNILNKTCVATTLKQSAPCRKQSS